MPKSIHMDSVQSFNPTEPRVPGPKNIRKLYQGACGAHLNQIILAWAMKVWPENTGHVTYSCPTLAVAGEEGFRSFC